MVSGIYCKTNQTLSLNFKIFLMDHDHESVLSNKCKNTNVSLRVALTPFFTHTVQAVK